MADGSDEREEGEKSSNHPKRKPEEEEPKGSFQAKGVPVLGFAVVVSTIGGSLALSLAGEFSLAGERSLAGESSLGGAVEADGISGAASGHSW